MSNVSMSNSINDDLKTLHTAAVDARAGYQEALQDADEHGLTSLFNDMIGLHTTNASELAAALKANGESPDEGGSFMASVHRTVMSVRSLFGGLGTSVLPGLIDGETRNVTTYDKTMRSATFPAATREMLTAQRHRIAAAITRMEAMKASVS